MTIHTTTFEITLTFTEGLWIIRSDDVKNINKSINDLDSAVGDVIRSCNSLPTPRPFQVAIVTQSEAKSAVLMSFMEQGVNLATDTDGRLLYQL